ncbi:hypothetical protein HD554DRAFT_2206321 [Boletus coccyginus]|nr:hypothetical protein HD554DRAFT_2206321 [Boletus coccyginus]
MAVLSLPLTFTNSFWTQDYRKGLEVLYSKLEQGVAENDEIVAFIRARANAENQLAAALLNPSAISSQGISAQLSLEAGFNRDDGASLLMTFRGLQAESAAQGQVHRDIAKDLQTLVVEPFYVWAQGYKERLSASKATALNNWLRYYEEAQKEVIKLKSTYLAKTRRADEAEDDAKFAPNNDLGDHYTTSPRLAPRDARTPQRSATVSERIAQRFKEIQRKAVPSTATTSDAASGAIDEKEEESPKVDKGKGKAVEESSPVLVSPPPMSPPLPPSKAEVTSSTAPPPPTPILLGGLSLPPPAVSSLLIRAAAELPLRPVRFPVIGEYPDCFSGAEFVEWLNKNVPGFGDNIDLAEEGARDLTERDDLLRRVGEFGNQFEHADDAYYQFRPKAFEIEGKSTEVSVTPVKRIHIADNLLKRSGDLVNVVTKALNANSQNEPVHVRLRHEADEADKLYRVTVRKLDRQRLGLEERIEEMLKTLQKWELERLAAVKTVLLQYQGTLAILPKAFEPTLQTSTTLIASYQPDSDLTALMERYRTGPFRPVPQLYESVTHDESDVVFGIDLRKWAEGGWSALTSGEEKMDTIPPVLTALLDGLAESYMRLPSDAEKRKVWIYDVPLPALHHLREALNAVLPGQPFSSEMLAMYDAPVLAGCVKLWALELDPPLLLWECWDDIRKLYPTVGSVTKADGELSEEQHLQDLQTALQRLPKVHLYVLDALVTHLRTLIVSTDAEEPVDIYMTKLALSIGRTIIRPKVETELSIQDRHPTLLFLDLLKNYDKILPPTIAKKQRESERRVPIRKRTAPVDMRMSRARISVGAPTRELLAAQQAAQKLASHSNVVASTPLPVTKTEEPVVIATEPKSIETPAPELHVPEPAMQDDTVPPRPVFKEPPPETDDTPPRPSFKEPSPEIDDIPLPRSTFVSPPSSSLVMEEKSSPSPAVAVTPATPHNPIKSLRRDSAFRSGSASPIQARSPSPSVVGVDSAAEDQPLTQSKSGLTRHTSGQVGVRGPRLSRAPRSQQGGVSGMIASFNNRSTAVSPPPSPGYKRLSGGTSRLSANTGTDSKRGIGRTPGGLSRRTMASDAEDEVVDK